MRFQSAPFVFLSFGVFFGNVLGCVSPVPASSPILISTPAPVQTPPPVVSPAQAKISTSAPLSLIIDAAAKSSCAAYDWKNRGHAPNAYVKGVALVYAKALCQQGRSDLAIVTRAGLGDPSTDALAWYGIPSGNRLRQVYTLLLGLGMRESGGRYCCGRDMSANFSSADSAEAGVFQTSWGARRSSGELAKLFAKYQASESGCLLDVFKEGIPCSAGNLKNWGDPSSDGFKWQALTKRCPAFATEYAAILIRVLGGTRGEFGPLRKKAAEIRPECD